MNPTLYALCHQPVIGAALWLATLCAIEPPVQETPIAVATAGTVLATRFSAPVDSGYFLSATFRFASTEERMRDTLVGASADLPCYGPGQRRLDELPASERARVGKPLRLKVMVRHLTSATVVYSQDLASICRAGHDGAATKSQVQALIPLRQGEHAIEVQNLEPRPDLAALRPSLVLHAGGK